jgi:hypothetical protein
VLLFERALRTSNTLVGLILFFYDNEINLDLDEVNEIVAFWRG